MKEREEKEKREERETLQRVIVGVQIPVCPEKGLGRPSSRSWASTRGKSQVWSHRSVLVHIHIDEALEALLATLSS